MRSEAGAAEPAVIRSPMMAIWPGRSPQWTCSLLAQCIQVGVVLRQLAEPPQHLIICQPNGALAVLHPCQDEQASCQYLGPLGSLWRLLGSIPCVGGSSWVAWSAAVTEKVKTALSVCSLLC